MGVGGWWLLRVFGLSHCTLDTWRASQACGWLWVHWGEYWIHSLITVLLNCFYILSGKSLFEWWNLALRISWNLLWQIRAKVLAIFAVRVIILSGVIASIFIGFSVWIVLLLLRAFSFLSIALHIKWWRLLKVLAWLYSHSIKGLLIFRIRSGWVASAAWLHEGELVSLASDLLILWNINWWGNWDIPKEPLCRVFSLLVSNFWIVVIRKSPWGRPRVLPDLFQDFCDRCLRCNLI